jgi:class 3 adenylate cyclase/tetratricopeptide (TPR) repeat protein
LLFVDLVGFTATSEGRDPADMQDLLSGYFDLARTIVGRYGGTVEKFIGDAVLAVWGSPVAREDDAERAVRAAFELVGAVSGYGETRGLPLRARAGVATGRVATWTNADDGLVVGDRVNTAARVQGQADPGCVYVDDPTKEATQAAVVYADTGLHRVKGKSAELRLWRAERIVAGVGGSQRVDGLEPPFVGRTRDLAFVKELFHATLEDRRPRSVCVFGAAGIGKSRLGWEFEKYVDGLAGTVLWHRGRCLPYGDGVAYSGLAEMVRQRFGIAEDDPPTEAAAKLESGLARFAAQGGDLDYLALRLGVLIGTAPSDLTREELFAGWRLFFERMARTLPVVVVLEDAQWADTGMLDFLEHLMDWCSDAPIFVLTLGRSELLERRPQLAGGRRGWTAVSLAPLPVAGMTALLEGLVPGMPAQAITQIIERAEGVPLYAVETIRTLVDRNLITAADGAYTLVGTITDLDVPATLTSLIASRLDALPIEERELVKDLAVLGGSFPRTSVTATSRADTGRVDEILSSLVRKEVLTVRADPLSPQKGHYAFVQTLLRTVAHQSLSRRERRNRHLAVAQHMREALAGDGEEASEIIAAHYLDAFHAADNPDDAEALRGDAVLMFERAGRRAAVMGAPDAAEKAYRTGAELALEDDLVLQLTERAGDMAQVAGRPIDALETFEWVAKRHRDAGRPREAAGLAVRIGRCLAVSGKGETAVLRMREALEVLSDFPGPMVARLHCELASALFFTGREDEVLDQLEYALALAEAWDMPDVLGPALMLRSMRLADLGRRIEAQAIMALAIDVLHEHELGADEAVALANLGWLRAPDDLPGALEANERALVLVRRLGMRRQEVFIMVSIAMIKLDAGAWDEAEDLAQAAVDLMPQGQLMPSLNLAHVLLSQLAALRGDVAGARAHLALLAAMAASDDTQDRIHAGVAAAATASSAGDHDHALTLARASTFEAMHLMGPASDLFRVSWTYAIEAALAADNLDAADELLALVTDIPPGQLAPFLRAQLPRCRALVAARRDEDPTVVRTDLLASVDALAELGYSYWHARAQLDLAQEIDRADEDRHGISDSQDIRAQAEATLDRLGVPRTGRGSQTARLDLVTEAQTQST